MIHREPLADRANSLRCGDLMLDDYLETLRIRIDTVDTEVKALLTESSRWNRLAGKAEALEDRYPNPSGRPPLYGIPVGVKDIFHVEGFPTKAGTNLPASVLSGPQSKAVTKLQEAGALVIGKTVTTEFAYFEPGPTRNPHHLKHTPGGSSSGSAAAVAAGLCPLALGTQTVGSVIRPAAYCGIIGYKPSYSRIPRRGVIPFSPSVDHVGLFSQDVAGAELAASVLCSDWEDASPDSRPTLGVPEGQYLNQADQEGREAFKKHVEVLEGAGYAIRHVPALESIDTINERHNRLIRAEAALKHHEWYNEYGDRYSETMTEIIETGRDVNTEELAAIRANRTEFRSSVESTMCEHAIDLLVTPAAPGPAPEGIDNTGDPVMNLPWTHSGLPTVTVPAGTATNGLPVGIQLVGLFMEDERLMSWSHGIAKSLSNAGE